MPEPITISLAGRTDRPLHDYAVLAMTLSAAGLLVPLRASGEGEGINASTTALTGAQGTKSVTTPGTPVLLVGIATLVDSVVIQAVRSRTAANTGVIYVGFSAVAANNVMQIPIGQTLTIQAPAGKKIDLHSIYIDAVVGGDGVSYTSLN